MNQVKSDSPIKTEEMRQMYEEIIKNSMKRVKKEEKKGIFYTKSEPKLYNNVGRNEPCPCGSGIKFKKCCIDKKKD